MPNKPSHTDQLQYLISTREFWGQYRTQKENAAWAAAALNLGGILGLATLIFNGAHPFSIFYRMGAIIIVMATLFLTIIFMQKQDDDRECASNMIQLCEGSIDSLLGLKEAETQKTWRKKYDIDDPPYWNLLAPKLAVMVWDLSFILALYIVHTGNW